MNVYRRAFINLRDFSELVRSLGDAKRVLEIGCGDGTLLEQLARAFPTAELVGIDIAPEPGRLFTGDRSRVTFRSITTSELLVEEPEPFDAVVICDVLHHVPPAERDQLLADARALTAAGGHLIVKDWVPARDVGTALVVLSDKYISRDPPQFPPADELRARLLALSPGDELVVEARVPPHRNNLAFVLRAKQPPA